MAYPQPGLQAPWETGENLTIEPFLVKLPDLKVLPTAGGVLSMSYTWASCGQTQTWIVKRVLPRLPLSCELISNRSVRVDILFLFFYFGVAKRVGSSVTNETSFVGYQIFNFFCFLKDWRRTDFWVVKSVGSSWLMVLPCLVVSCKFVSNRSDRVSSSIESHSEREERRRRREGSSAHCP